MSRLRVACVGTGFIAGRHLSALAALPDVDVVAVADAQPDRADDVARRHGATAYTDGLELLEREDLDAGVKGKILAENAERFYRLEPIGT